jgi:antitoxin ParD1/3/4
MATMNISLPDSMREWVEHRVRDGQYANVGDYVRDLIRHDRESHQALERALIEGEESGISTRSVRDIIKDTKSKLGHAEG